MTKNNSTEATATDTENAPQSEENPANGSEATESATNPATGQQGAKDGNSDGDGADESADEDKGKPKRPNEAAKYRTRLREAEAERDQLKADFEAEQTQLTDRVKLLEEATIKAWNHGGALSTKALQAAGIELSSLFNEDGTLNVKAVDEANQQAATALGIPYTPVGVVPRNLSEELDFTEDLRTSNGEVTWGNILGNGR